MPAASERPWAHPSEFGSFDPLPEMTWRTRPRHYSPVLVGLVALFLGTGTWLLTTASKNPAPALALTSHVAVGVSDLPAVARDAAPRVLEVTASSGGHLLATAAVIASDGREAVTTLPLRVSDDVVGATLNGQHVRLFVDGHDDALGLTFFRLRSDATPTLVDPLPASTSVVALAPVMTHAGTRPTLYWASTSLGDPFRLVVAGQTSTLATASASNLNGATGAVAIDASGKVVALLNASGAWLPADYVLRVADAWRRAPHCHGRLGVTVTDATEGGALVTAVAATGPSAGVLRQGDVITGLDDDAVNDFDGLVSILYATPGHERARLTLTRGGVVVHAVTTLACAP